MASKSFERIIDEISALTVIELSELVKSLQEKFGVSAAMPAAAASAAAAPAAEEKSEFKVELLESGPDKIKVIKALRQLNKDLSLTEAKNVVEGAPAVLFENAKKEDAQKMKQELEAVGAKVKLS